MRLLRPIALWMMLLAPMGALCQQATRPRLVVGIVVDQMRYDLLTRFAHKYGTGGFNRLVNQGVSFQQMHFNYMPTYTAPGHASVYAGSAPETHGIIGNDWYDRSWGRNIYCVTDTTTPVVGGSAEAGFMSPRNLLVGNLSDQLVQVSPQSKVIALALKDRGAILPGGHRPTGAYWFDRKTGNWVTSTYYRNDLPAWVQRFNQRKLPDSLTALGWKPLLPLSQYTESSPDRAPGEAMPFADKRNTLPYKLSRTNGYTELLTSPHGNTLTTQFALAATAGEGLGLDEATDFLLISYSSTDYAGHQFGPNSVEIQDMYLKLDRELAQLLVTLERRAGAGRVLVFLTADHGVADLPETARAQHRNSGRFDVRLFRDSIEKHLQRQFQTAVFERSYMRQEGPAQPPTKWIQEYTNQQVYLNLKGIERTGLPVAAFEAEVARFARSYPHVAEVICQPALATKTASIPAIARGWHPQRSGNVAIIYEPGWFDRYGIMESGTTHGTHYDYDTHVPFVVWGWGVRHATRAEPVVIPDIAPTIARHIGIPAPPQATGKALELR